ncbi:hypothetical protein BO82DRAFT_354732 [Aspergillus uvarum CBS 121591]|uniref:Uncharacterized protein n=1 Tax=Aspergillus uvarum CBS 121591 TaxID=1448315 RepID=A0A319D026_9EURO|nr:hypothetical protein BO82DRAFT_354732 [Aspergillus uvarum CBS 121591]PYH81278.1 hypothetical protein BO82DRAFT_354732 [Aspergillus uvarum CBS 121591]
MYSYHRVLALFGRSVKDKTLECDCDIHPWEIQINGKQWSGKIRLVGFVDVFFLFAYSANASFEKGIIVYKDRFDLKSLVARMDESHHRPPPPTADQEEVPVDSVENKRSDHLPDATNQPSDDQSPSAASEGEAPTQGSNPRLTFKNESRYEVDSWGHEIELQYEYLTKDIQKYCITINKPYHRALRRAIKRGIKEHTTTELLEDLVRCGFITQGELVGKAFSKYIAGGVMEDTMSKYFSGMTGGDHRPGKVDLSNGPGL